MKNIILLGLIYLSVFQNVTAQSTKQSFDDLLKIEKEYIKGDYKVGIKRTKRLIQKAESDQPSASLYLARLHFILARLYEGMGKFSDYSTQMEKGNEVIQLADKTNVQEYILTLKEAAYAYHQFGDYLKAQKAIEQAVQLIETSNLKSTYLDLDVRHTLVMVYVDQQYDKRATAMIPELLSLSQKRISKKDEVVDPLTGQKNTRKLSKSELLDRKRKYAELLNLLALIKLEEGDDDGADSVLNVASVWIRKNIRKKDFTYLENLYLKGRVADNRISHKAAYKNYKKAYKMSTSTRKGKYRSTNKNVVRYMERIINGYRNVGKNGKARRMERGLNAKIKSYYGKKSIYKARIILVQAERYYADDEMKKADEKLNDVLEGTVYIPAIHMERVRALEMKHNVLIRAHQYKEAEQILAEIVKIKSELMGTAAPGYHIALLDMANHEVLYGNNFRSAEEVYNNSLRKVVSVEIDHLHKKYVDYLFEESLLYEYTDRFKKANDILFEAEKEVTRKYGVNHARYAEVLDKEANIAIQLGKYPEAEDKLKQSLEIFKKHGGQDDNLKYAHTLETQARLNIVQGNYDEAESDLKKAYSLTKRTDEDERMSDAIEELASLYIETGKYSKTEKNLKESIKHKQALYGNDHRSLINPYNQLAHLYLVTGDFTEAEKNVKLASSIAEKVYGDTSVKYSESLSLLEKIYTAIGDYHKAEEVGLKRLAILKSHYGEDHIQVANSLNDLALLKYYNHSSDEEVEKLFLEAQKIIRKTFGDTHPRYADILENTALFYIGTEKIKKAEDNLNKADQIWISKLGKSNKHTGDISFLKGNIEYRKENYQGAKKLYDQSAGIYQGLFEENHPNYVRALSKSAQMSFIMGDKKEAVRLMDMTISFYITFINKYFPSLSEREKNKYWTLIKSDFEFYYSLMLDLKNEKPDLVKKAFNNAIATKALLLNSSIKVRQRVMSSNDSTLISKYEEWVSQKEYLTTVISMTVDQRKAEGIDLKDLEKKVEDIEKELSENSELFASNYEVVNPHWDDVEKTLKDNEYAVEIVRFRLYTNKFTDSIYYGAFIVNPKFKSGPQFVLIQNGNELENKYLKYFRNAVKFNLKDQYSYNNFWAPLTKYIPENSTVYLSPEGAYNQVNPEVFLTPGGSYLLNLYNIVLISSSKDLVKNEIAKARAKKLANKKNVINKAQSVFLVGNPDFYATAKTDSVKVQPLPGAEKEVKSLEGLIKEKGWQPEVFLNAAATEEKIKEVKDPKVFHIATHGFFMEDQKTDEKFDEINDFVVPSPLLRSGLVLASGGELLDKENVYEFNSQDGILTAYEAMNLYFDNTDLVVLSACETGVGQVMDGEGVYGLQRAFQVAGAKTIIMTLFKVDDEVTQELMNIFYSKWLSGMDRRQAFLEAKKEIRAKYNNPKYWASFIMIGLE